MDAPTGLAPEQTKIVLPPNANYNKKVMSKNTIVELVNLLNQFDDSTTEGLAMLSDEIGRKLYGGLKYANDTCNNNACNNTNKACYNSACTGGATGNSGCTNMGCAS